MGIKVKNPNRVDSGAVDNADTNGFLYGLKCKTPDIVASGIHDGGDNQASMTDSGASFTPDAFIGMAIKNNIDESIGVITDNTETNVTATLGGGSEDDWDDDDIYSIDDRRKVEIGVGNCTSDDASMSIVVDSPITVDITASGVNGLDTGSESSDTWYYIYVIYNPTTDTTAGLLSVSSSSPTMPSGYTKKRRVGVARKNGDSNFIPFRTERCGQCKHIIYGQAYRVLNNGTSETYTDVDCSDAVPPTSRLAWSTFQVTEDGATGRTSYRENGNFVENDFYVIGYDDILVPSISLQLDANQIFEYRCDAGTSCKVKIAGYFDDL